MQEFTPLEYIKIDIASNFGLDKETWDSRLEWFDVHEDKLEQMVFEADEPALFFAGVEAYRKAQRGQSINYPISLDATASGAQILALLAGCERSAMLSNVIDSGDRLDFYTEITKLINQYSEDDVKISRSDAKDAIMPSFYGSTKAPKDVFGEGALYELFQKIMSIASPGIWNLNSMFLALWDSDALEFAWVMPDNFHAKFKVKQNVQHEFSFLGMLNTVTIPENKPIENGKALGANIIHSLDGMVVRELTARCNYNAKHITNLRKWALSNVRNISRNRSKDKTLLKLLSNANCSGYYPVRMLDYIDKRNIGLVDQTELLEMLNSLPFQPFQILSIHDCFRVHPNYGNDLRKQYNMILSKLAQSDMLNFIVQQLGNKLPIHIPNREHLAAAAVNAEYALS